LFFGRRVPAGRQTAGIVPEDVALCIGPPEPEPVVVSEPDLRVGIAKLRREDFRFRGSLPESAAA